MFSIHMEPKKPESEYVFCMSIIFTTKLHPYIVYKPARH